MLINLAKQIICSVILLLIFCILFAIKRNLLPSEIIFYESLQLGIIFILLLSLVTVFFETKFTKFIKSNLYSSFLLIVLFNAMIPTILDRSVSVTVIGSLKKSDTPLELGEIQSSFNKIYIIEQDAVNIRLKEQIANGNIKKNNEGKFFLTKKGEVTSQIMLGISYVFNVNTAYIEQ